MTPCTLVQNSRRFGTWCLHLCGTMEAAGSSEKQANFHQTTRRHIPEHSVLPSNNFGHTNPHQYCTLPVLHSEAAAHGTECASLFCDEAEATSSDTNCTASTFVKIIKALSCFLLRERNARSVAQLHNFIKVAANCLQQHSLCCEIICLDYCNARQSQLDLLKT
jgi:hypothetical protein